MAQATFINIPTDSLCDVLTKAGFTDVTKTLPRTRFGHVGERVFDREHHRFSNVKVRVYTSIDVRTNLVRDIDLDRIVVCAVYTDGTKVGHDRKSTGRFLFAAKGVNRASGEADQAVAVKAILDRMLSRMRDVYGQINKAETCPTCGEPVKLAKSRKRWISKGRRGRGRYRKSNPNFKRPYKACMADACSFFEWTGPVVEDETKTPATITKSDPMSKPESIEGKTIVRVDPLDEPAITTEAKFEQSVEEFKANTSAKPVTSTDERVKVVDEILSGTPKLEDPEDFEAAEFAESAGSSSVDDARAMFSRR
jgi:ribosomal protein S27AE